MKRKIEETRSKQIVDIAKREYAKLMQRQRDIFANRAERTNDLRQCANVARHCDERVRRLPAGKAVGLCDDKSSRKMTSEKMSGIFLDMHSRGIFNAIVP
jgi:hypothetical protein